jgi:type IV pilus assembly protein PilV
MNRKPTSGTLFSALPHCRGLTLVEILVALLVLSIGLLGFAALQTTSLRFNTSAYYRTQATALAYDLADRMRANRQAAIDGAYTVGFQDPPPACNAIAVGVGSVAEQDIAAWRSALACRVPQSTGSVVPNGNEFTVTVQWDDSHGEQDPMVFEMTTAL